MIARFIAPMMLVAACSAQPDHRPTAADPAVVEAVNLQRYEGKWYEIARYPNAFEDKAAYTCIGVTAEYTLREDGKITVTNTCRKDRLDGDINIANGVARVVDNTGAKLKVRFAPGFIPFAEGDYWILDLTEDYTAALVGDPAGKYLWILSRTKVLPDTVMARMLAAAQDKGYATAPLKLVRQVPTR